MPKQNRQDLLPRDYTFSRLYSKCSGRESQQFNKLLCLINYFKRAQTADNTFITFHRAVLTGRKNWSTEETDLIPVSIETQPRCIEDLIDHLMVDFANLSIGGGVLGSGCVQEEIMFLVCVEPIVAMLFTELLQENEAMTIVGTQRYNEVKGYKTKFTWNGDFQDSPGLDLQGRYDRHIVAIDAAIFIDRVEIQYRPDFIHRELNKAYLGFLGDPTEIGRRTLATGGWGCGAFSGDESLKLLIQWCAASVARRPMHYILWKPELASGINEITAQLTSRKVGEVVSALLRMPSGSSVFEYVLRALTR